MKKQRDKMFTKRKLLLFLGGLVLFFLAFSTHTVQITDSVNIETAYAFGAFFAVLLGPIYGLLIGVIGHTASDIILYGEVSIGWVIASGLSLFFIGLSGKIIKIEEQRFGLKQGLIFNVVQAFSFFISFYVVAGFFDVVVFLQDPVVTYSDTSLAVLLDILSTGFLGTVALKLYNFVYIGDSFKKKSKSASKQAS